jgi:isopenicillin N synthase-like dioxygenase
VWVSLAANLQCILAAKVDSADVEVPVVDLSGPSDRAAVELDRACSEVGFVQVVGHGLDGEIERAAWECAREFFDLPERDKLEVAIPPGDAYGYGPYRVERLASSLGVDTPPDLKETFSIGPAAAPPGLLADDPAAAFSFSPNRLPGALSEMERIMRAYYDDLAGLVDRVLALMAAALGLDADHFTPLTDRHTSALRLLRYPDLSGTPTEPGQLRAGAHSDYGTLTLLRQDDAPGGLEVLGADDRWIGVPAVKGAYVVNIGDALERWTNGRWRSTLHRVALPPANAMGSTERQSLAFFHNANWDAVIDCLEPCRPADLADLPPPITAGRHLMEKFQRTQSDSPR